jgi:hypothetical protein
MAETYSVQVAEYITNDEIWESYQDCDYYDVDVDDRIVWNRFESDLKDEAEALEKAGEALKTYRTVRVKKHVTTVTHTF